LRKVFDDEAVSHSVTDDSIAFARSDGLRRVGFVRLTRGAGHHGRWLDRYGARGDGLDLGGAAYRDGAALAADGRAGFGR
jgi:hypothetical protein